MQIDHIHFYVDDAEKWGNWFVNLLRFQPVPKNQTSEVLNLFEDYGKKYTETVLVKSGKIAIALSSPLTADSPVARYLANHPPGVADVALRVQDVALALEKAQARGAKILQPLQHDRGRCWGKIAAWGSLTHTLIEESAQSVSPAFVLTQGVFTDIDHVVLNVAAGELELAAQWYEQVLGFERQQSFTIQTEQSGLYSQVMVHPASGLKFPINQPASENSQIQEFLSANRGAGIQHIALQTPRLVQSIPQLRAAGMNFLAVPASYYAPLKPQYCAYFSEEEWEAMARSQILVDRQDPSSQAFLLQIFTQPIFAEPTFFFEMIERRHQAQGFGEGNFRALFQAIEREQMKRTQKL